MRYSISPSAALALLAATLLCWLVSFPHPVEAQLQTRVFNVSGQGIPSSLTAPTPVQGTSLANVPLTADVMVIANTDSADHTITIEDYQSTPFILFNGATIKAGTTWFMYMPGTRFQGLKWSASSTTVMGSIVGHR